MRIQAGLHGVQLPGSSNTGEPQAPKLSPEQEKALEAAQKAALERVRERYLKNG